MSRLSLHIATQRSFTKEKEADMTAGREEIVRHFLSLDYNEWTTHNWGLHPDRTYWNVTLDTYINGIPLMVDLDYMMGYLLEIVERDTSAVSYLVIVKTPKGHDSAWYEKDAGTFFDRDIDVDEVSIWAVEQIYGLLGR